MGVLLVSGQADVGVLLVSHSCETFCGLSISFDEQHFCAYNIVMYTKYYCCVREEFIFLQLYHMLLCNPELDQLIGNFQLFKMEHTS